jgi:hypothetical protein
MPKQMKAKLDRDIAAFLREDQPASRAGRGGRDHLAGYEDAEVERLYRAAGGATSGDAMRTAILGDPAYSRRFISRGWNIRPTILDDPQLAVRHHNVLGIPTSKSAHRQRADAFRVLQGRFQTEHRALIRRAEQQYGAHGPVISGGLHEDWPERVKERVRFVAHGIPVLESAVRLHEALAKSRSPAFR